MRWGEISDVSAVCRIRTDNGVRLCFVDVDAVERDVRLVGTRAGNVTISRGGRLQREQARHIARFERQLSNLFINKSGTQRCVISVHQKLGRGGGNSYRLSNVSDLQRHIYGRWA